MSCSIFTKPIIQDIPDTEKGVFDISWLRNLIPPLKNDTSGLWQPIWINLRQSKANYVSPLFPVKSNRSNVFPVCECKDTDINFDPLYSDESRIGFCSYCDNPNAPKTKWRLWDRTGASSPREYPVSCCSGGCDTMFKSDDYIPKVPYLNHAYITGAVDSKHHLEFPACNNLYLGCENFVYYDNLDSIQGAQLRTDWRIQETISEIPYERFTSQHSSKHLHDMAYQKSLNISSTCGNFIMLSLPDSEKSNNNFYRNKYNKLQNLIFSDIPDDTPDPNLPSIELFKKVPYGFDKETYKNIFVSNEKHASYWKWNYTSGILCWYRYYDAEDSDVKIAAIRTIQANSVKTEKLDAVEEAAALLDQLREQDDNNQTQQAVNNLNAARRELAQAERMLQDAIGEENRLRNIARTNDKRPIPGVDLYISPGDIFFAKNDGPEPQGNLINPFANSNGLISSCPSGLKTVIGSDVSTIIPSGSNFVYISANIYEQFYNLYYKVIDVLEEEDSDEGSDKRMRHRKAFMVASQLATAPQYDQITVDLLKRTLNGDDYITNIYGQIDILNRDMSVTTQYDSVSRLNYISNKTELFDTISQKYGAYLWIPPNSTKTISFKNSLNSVFALNLNFDLALLKSDTKQTSSSCSPITSCTDRTFNKRFTYDQTIGYSLSSISTETNKTLRHSRSCDSEGNLSDFNFALYSNIYLNQSLIKSVYSFNGCYTLSGLYPRISQQTDTKFCKNCDEYSSFYLIPGADEVECISHTGKNNQSFCYSSLAKAYQDNPSGTFRTEREVADGTKRLIRSYRSSFFNPYLDSVAFHQDNGAFVNSYPFDLNQYVAFEQALTSPKGSSNNIYFTFTTQDLGLKIYDIETKYIQSQNERTSSCERFPVVEKCKCLPMISPDAQERPINCDNPDPKQIKSANIFTPSLSTKYSRRLEKYGGFTQEYLDKLFGPGVVTAGGFIPVLNAYQSPQNIEKCDSSDSITLYNYVNSKWKIKLLNLDKDAELYVTSSENINFVGPRKVIFIDMDSQINPTWGERVVKSSRRFTNKVTINDTVLYARQTTKLNNSSSNLDIDINVKNPFLSKAISTGGGDEDAILYPPSGRLFTDYIYGNRGNESTAVTLTFKQFFKKHKLLFVIPPVPTMGSLKLASFNPNSGLSDTPDEKTPIKNNSIYYVNELFDESKLLPGKVFYGELNEKALNSIYALDEFDMHKKLRLFIKLNNKWFYHTGSNIGSFKVDNTKYPGFPTFFEYSSKTKSKKLPGMLVGSVKKHIDFNFINNKMIPLLNKNNAQFPYLFNDVSLFGESRLEIQIPGLRHYFMVPEIDVARRISITTIRDISNLSPSFANIKYGDTIVLNDKTRWICIDENKINDPASYVFSPFTYWTQYYNDLKLNFGGINKNGYIYNSKKACNFNIKLKVKDAVTLRPSTMTNTIVEKSIYVKYVNENNIESLNTSLENIYIQPYTVFKLANFIPRSMILDLIEIFQNKYYFTIGQINTPRSERSSLLLNPYLPGKWGDLINYDGDITDPVVGAMYDIDRIFPKAAYDNLLYKAIINNYAEEFIYRIKGKGINVTEEEEEQEEEEEEEARTFYIPSGSGLVYYCTLNPYAIGYEGRYAAQVDKYQNFVPLIDINILESSGVQKLNLPVSGSGIINVAHLTKEIQPSGNYIPYSGYNNDKNYFWFALESGAKLQRTFAPLSNFYSDTLRLDYPMYWLSNITSSRRLFPDKPPYVRIFDPRSASTTVDLDPSIETNASFNFTSEYRSTPYWRYPIYGDKDDNTCANSGCFGGYGADDVTRSGVPDHGIDIAGVYGLHATYRIAQNTDGPEPANAEFYLGYDAGLYNAIGNSLVKIQRIELQPNNILNKNLDNCTNDKIFPSNYDINPMSPIFQNVIKKEGIVIENNLDIVANEMLFRILYGEAKPVNKKMYFVDNLIYTKQDLIAYTDPRVTAEDIYSQILYNYDKSANNPMKIKGSFDILGVLSVGATATVIINNVTINLSIINVNNVIYITYSGQGQSGRVVLYEELRKDTVLFAQRVLPDEPDPPAPLPHSENEVIELVDEIRGIAPYRYGLANAEGYEDYIKTVTDAYGASTQVSLVESTTNSISWGNSYGFGSINFGPNNCWPNDPRISSVTYIPPNSTMFNYRQKVCGEEQTGRVVFVPATYTASTPCINESNKPSPTYLNSSTCTPFDIGYCRKSDCPTCSETIQNVEQKNFTYDWSYCRTKLTTYGHVYREIHAFDDTPIYVEPYAGETCSLEDECDPSSVRCTPNSWPLDAGSRAQTERYLIENALSGLGDNPCDGSCPGATPIFGGVEECTGNEKTASACCRSDTVCCYGQLNGADFCYTGSMFSDGKSWIGPPDINKCGDWKHLCGVARNGDKRPWRYKVFRSTTTTNTPYDPVCANRLCSIFYNNKTIILNILDQKICFNATINKCPNITVNSTMNQFSVSADTIESNCDECLESAISITMPPQQMKFVTKREKRKCILGTLAVCSANPRGLVGSWLSVLNPGGQPGSGPGSSVGYMSQCGGGAPEYVCGKIGRPLITSSDNTYDIVYECLESIDCGIPSALASYEIEERKESYNLQLSKGKLIPLIVGRAVYPGNNLYLGEGSVGVPIDQIIEGVVPGTISTSVIVESYNAGGQSITRTGGITNNVSTVYVFYYTYDYIRPLTLEEAVRNDTELVCGYDLKPVDTSDIKSWSKYSQCSTLSFPNNYAFNYLDTTFFNYRGSDTTLVSFTLQNPVYEKVTCQDNLSCYHKHKVFICGQASIWCDLVNGLRTDEGPYPNTSTMTNKIPCHQEQFRSINLPWNEETVQIIQPDDAIFRPF